MEFVVLAYYLFATRVIVEKYRYKLMTENKITSITNGNLGHHRLSLPHLSDRYSLEGFFMIFIISFDKTLNILFKFETLLTDTGEDSKLVHRRKRPKVDTLYSSLLSEASERRV